MNLLRVYVQFSRTSLVTNVHVHTSLVSGIPLIFNATNIRNDPAYFIQ